jgi:hypothetical protein
LLRGLLGTRGQVALETAIILPLMVLMVLGIVQLTLIQQARILTENAAYNAARAGIVFSADRSKMTQAAFISVIPALPIIQKDNMLGSLTGLIKYFATQQLGFLIDQTIEQIASQLGIGFSGLPSFALVRVDIVNPTQASFQALAKDFPGISETSELDFDDTTNNDKLREANRLVVRTRFLYQMRIPFANYIIHKAYMAQEAGVRLTGPIYSSRVAGQQWNENSAADAAIGGRLPAVDWLFGDKDSNMLTILWNLSKNGTFYVPLRATYSMRMQSNIFLNNLQSGK